jgi:hypothetical protein
VRLGKLYQNKVTVRSICRSGSYREHVCGRCTRAYVMYSSPHQQVFKHFTSSGIISKLKLQRSIPQNDLIAITASNIISSLQTKYDHNDTSHYLNVFVLRQREHGSIKKSPCLFISLASLLKALVGHPYFLTGLVLLEGFLVHFSGSIDIIDSLV